MKDLPHKARFERYRDDALIAKCERYAHWTLPYLMSDPDLNPRGMQVPVERDYQEMGALLTNNLATKLAALLFPVNVPFFEAAPSEKLIEDAKQRGIDETTLRSELANLTTAACKRVFHNGGYAQLVGAVRHLIVTGNVLLRRVAEDQTYIAYGLQHYSVRRDGMGRVMDTILRERADFETLPPDVQKELRRVNPGKYRRAKPDCVVQQYSPEVREDRQGILGGVAAGRQHRRGHTRHLPRAPVPVHGPDLEPHGGRALRPRSGGGLRWWLCQAVGRLRGCDAVRHRNPARPAPCAAGPWRRH
mgnify:CR=1 FL=1